MFNIVVIDGQGGGLGKSVISKLRCELGDELSITALGTNPHAAKAMIKAGAAFALYGEEYITEYIKNKEISCLIAPIGILCSGGINGEVSHKLSEIVFKKDCTKYIIPLKKHGFYIPGTTNLELKEIIQEIVDEIKKCQELTS